MLALAALAKRTTGKDKAIDPNADASTGSVAAGPAQAIPITALEPADASSTAAAILDLHGDRTEKPDPSTPDAAQAATPSADSSASQPIAAPQPVAVPVSAPVMPALPTPSLDGGDGGDGQDGGSGQDAAQIAALGDAVKSGLAGKAGAAPIGDPKPALGTAGANRPSLGPQPGQGDPSAANGSGQSSPSDATAPRDADGSPASAAAADQSRQRAARNRQSDGAAAQDNSNGNSAGNTNVDPSGNPNAVDPNADPKRDPSGSTNRIEDITRLALDPSVRHVESSTAETSSAGPAHPGSGEGAQPTPDGALAPAILTTAAAPTADAATTATPAAIPIAGLAVEIASQAHAGKNRFEIRLDPPELGRIDVRLDVDRDGKVTSRLIVDRPETLEILRKDAPQLERSLQQAGLTTADDALQFSLRDQSGGSGNQNPYSGDRAATSPPRVIIPDAQLPAVEAVTASYGRVVGRSTGIDIRV